MRPTGGIDISERAIAMAKERNAGSDWRDKMIFTTGTIDDMPDKEADLVRSLGLLDWLGEEEISKIFSRQGGARFLHSISNQGNLSLQQLIHRLYVQVSYGYRTNGYVPQYHSIARDRCACSLKRPSIIAIDASVLVRSSQILI